MRESWKNDYNLLRLYKAGERVTIGMSPEISPYVIMWPFFN